MNQTGKRKHVLTRILKITGITFVSIILLLFLLPYLFPQTITSKIKQWTNQRINGELSFTSVHLSFFRHFPALTLTLNDFTLKGSAPFRQDTLVSAKEISLGLDISTVFKGQLKVNKIFLSHAFINVQVDSSGNANYNVYVSKPSKTTTNENDTSGM
ncbi:MAG TPA: AsmA family protein, partial [Flavipsychrobacter sp.]|nr:AsmA family protein [Flavipsychrobacter sp.]